MGLALLGYLVSSFQPKNFLSFTFKLLNNPFLTSLCLCKVGRTALDLCPPDWWIQYQRDRKRIYPFTPSRRNPLEAFLLLLQAHRLWISNDSTKACRETCYSTPEKPPHESVICSTIGALRECLLGLLGDLLTGMQEPGGCWDYLFI